MNKFHKVFKNAHVVLPVIHVEYEYQVLENAETAFDAGCDGVFLIAHGTMSHKMLLRISKKTEEKFPGRWVGVNCLDLEAVEVFREVPKDTAGIWVDNARIDEREAKQIQAESVRKMRKKSGCKALYFGGVAFKYQRSVEDAGKAARIAAKFMDVVTTSGPGTGHAAPVDKIRTMKEALGDSPLAIASGITPENVGDYLPWTDCFLVATGISKNVKWLDLLKTKALVKRVREELRV